MLTNVANNLKYVPYKMGEPKRLMALLIGVVGLAAGYSVTAKQGDKWASGWKMFLMSFGAVSIAAYIAGVLNPVTLYNNDRFAADVGTLTQPVGYIPVNVTAGAGDVTGQATNPINSRTAEGAYYSALPSRYVPRPAVTALADTEVIAPASVPELGTRPDSMLASAIFPGRAATPVMYNSGDVVGQQQGATGGWNSALNMANQAGGTQPYYSADDGLLGDQATLPALYGSGMRGESMYIRSPGEIEFSGGI